MELPPISILEEVLLNSNETITKRTRALFYLRTHKTEEVVPVIIKAFNDPSLLLQHEICYVLGQINLKSALSFLKEVLENEDNATISRHEAAEAIGAIGDQNSKDLMLKYCNHPDQILAETCQISLDRLSWLETDT